MAPSLSPNPGYSALHQWVHRHKPNTGICENCGKDPKLNLQILHAANISGKYLRDINDYRWLCSSCHGVTHAGRKRPNKK